MTGWLVSGVFGLEQARSVEAERAIESAEAWMRGDVAELPAELSTQAKIHAELQRVLAGHDPVLAAVDRVGREERGERRVIPFEKVPEPATFEANGRARGRAWLEANPDAKRPKDYWSPFKPALSDGFRMLCGYSAMFEPVGTVDHFVSVDEDRELAYEWSNYRYASAWINSSKQSATGLLDPFEVGDDWFEILLPSLQLVVSNRVPASHQAKAKRTLTRLHLDHDERVIRQRRAWYELYQAQDLTLDGLRKRAPLIARAIEKKAREESA